MELKDMILSTLEEIEEEVSPIDALKKEETAYKTFEPTENVISTKETEEANSTKMNVVDNELLFLKSIRERLLVLFEGFQAPNNANLEAKIDMTLNFLEYTLATIDERVKVLEKDKI
ncbi:CiaD-like domain-containing protein [Sulfurimonas marina]|uniref:Campylobacter invasion antigen D C-terminal domain-containing protein n=1 Tax=Sulfurimonas marina TaxID=2590551 RepID=A0A7M1AUZ3_9BACT|nr:hypothetical protein [Sulfurimonas marina]QOP41244.1 hypothetical protein FJR03_05600 [Sulfurimonas marina]